MKTNSYALQHDANRASSATADAALEFARFRVLLRRRQLLADGVSVVVGTRAFDLLLVLLEADGLLFAKDVIRTEFGGGYRFSRMLCVNGARTPVNLPCDKKALVWPNSYPQNCRQSLRCSFSSS